MVNGQPPKSIRIGPLSYSVKFSVEKITAFKLEEQSDYCGYVNHKRQEIIIDPALEDDRKQETLTHEMMHAILCASSLNDELKNNESFVSKFSPWLLDTLQRNPALVSYLTLQAEGGEVGG